jgi:hypothetical protein
MGPDGRPLPSKESDDKSEEKEQDNTFEHADKPSIDSNSEQEVKLEPNAGTVSEDISASEISSEQEVKPEPDAGTASEDISASEITAEQEGESEPAAETCSEDRLPSESSLELGDKSASDGPSLTGNELAQGFVSQFEGGSEINRMPQNIMNTGASDERAVPQEIRSPKQFFVRTKTGEQINIDKAEFKIGHKASEVDYAVTDNSAISRVHCVITKRNGVCFVRDNKSTNGTFVNGSELPLGKEQFLTNGASMILGDEEFIFHVE